MATAIRLVHSAPLKVDPPAPLRIEAALELARWWAAGICQCGHPSTDHRGTDGEGECDATDPDTIDPFSHRCGCRTFIAAPIAVVRTGSL